MSYFFICIRNLSSTLYTVHGTGTDRADLERIVTIVIEFQFVVIGIEKRGPGREGLEGLGALECASL